MRRPLALILVALILAALPLQAGTQSQLGDGKMQNEAIQLVYKAGDLVKRSHALHVEATIVTEVEYYGNRKRELRSETTFDFSLSNPLAVTDRYDEHRPGRLAIRTRHSGKDDTGFDMVRDGGELVRFDRLTKDYFRYGRVPVNQVGNLLLSPPQVPISQTGMLFQNLLNENPGRALMDNVTLCRFAGKAQVGGIDTHHIHFEQPAFVASHPSWILDWDLWIAADGPAVVLKARSMHLLEGGGRAATTETYRNWRFNEEPPLGVFKMPPPPPPAKPVDNSAPAAPTAKSTGGSTPKTPAWLPGRAPGVR